MIYIRDFIVTFWMSVGVIWWLIANYHEVNPLSYGIMELVLLALMVAWIEIAAETWRIWKEEME